MTDQAMPEDSLVRHMALTHVEFLRSLPAAAEGWVQEIDGPRILLTRDRHRVEINLGQEGERRIGSLRLPQTDVELRFFGFDDDTRRAFLKRFDLAYQRGGG